MEGLKAVITVEKRTSEKGQVYSCVVIKLDNGKEYVVFDTKLKADILAEMFLL